MPTVAEEMSPHDNMMLQESQFEEEGGTALPLTLKLALLTLFLPEGMSFFVAGLRLTLTRMLFLAVTPTVFMRLSAKISTGQYRFVASDLFIPLTALWMFVGPGVVNGMGDSLQHSGPVVLEYMISYMATRVLLSENRQTLSFVGLLCLIVCFVVLDGVFDTATGKFFTRGIVEQITGYYIVENEGPDSFRFGLRRAAGPLEHTILFGFTSATGLLLAAAVEMPWRKICIAAGFVGVVISFSSGPEQVAIMGLGLLAYSRVFPRLRHKWILLSVLPVMTVIALFSATDTPFGHVFDLVTIDPQTAYYRLYIWQSVGPAILQNPYFAVLEGDVDYHGSVDSVWLVLSLTYGMPCAILTALSMIGACSLPTSGPDALLSQEEERLGTMLGIIIFLIILLGFSVHFWGSVWIMIGLLVGLRAHLGELGALRAASAPYDFEP